MVQAARVETASVAGKTGHQVGCASCGELHFSPSVEAFEITGKLYCDDCADDAIILFEDAIQAEPEPYFASAMFDGDAEYASRFGGR